MVSGSRVVRAIKGWAEQDVYTPWRHRYCYTQRPGVCKSVKRETHRRERREAKREMERT